MKKRISGLIGEFKAFAFKGNVVDMAVGVMIGGAFGKISTSLVNDIFMPLISLMLGRVNISDWFVALDGGSYATADAAQAAGAPVFRYGAFLSTVLDFLLTAICVFVVVKLLAESAAVRAWPAARLRALMPSHAAAPAPAEPPRRCPYCRSEIDREATRCPYCTSVLDAPDAAQMGGAGSAAAAETAEAVKVDA